MKHHTRMSFASFYLIRIVCHHKLQSQWENNFLIYATIYLPLYEVSVFQKSLPIKCKPFRRAYHFRKYFHEIHTQKYFLSNKRSVVRVVSYNCEISVYETLLNIWDVIWQIWIVEIWDVYNEKWKFLLDTIKFVR